MVIDMNFLKQIAFFRKKTPTKVRKLVSFKDKTSTEYKAALTIKKVLDPLVDTSTRDLNQMVETLFKKLMANRMGFFTIVKFDMKNYFPSISLRYAYEYYIKDKIDKKYWPLFEKYCDEIKYNLQGLPTSSNFADIMSKALKDELIDFFHVDGLTNCFYYVDDFVLLFKKRVNEIYIKFGILECIKKVFYKYNTLPYQNKVKAHIDDEKYVFLDDTKLPANFTWLGYKIGITYGWQGIGITLDISDFKRNWYQKVISKAVKDNYQDEDKMRIMLYASTRSLVTKIRKAGMPSKNISLSPYKFYKNLKKYPELIGEDTRRFMKDSVKNAFVQQNISVPYYIKDNNPNSGYSIWHNFFSNKAVVLNKKIGWSYQKLYDLLKKYTNEDIHSKSYDELANIFIKNFVISMK